MFDLGFAELLVIGIVALIVVGPKDLPVLFRNVGRWIGRIRGMAREFSRAMNDAADDAGVSDIQKTLKTATNPVGSAMQGVKDATKDLASGFDPTNFETKKFDANSETGKLAAERAEQTKKIQAATARKAADRLQKQAEDARIQAEAAEAALNAPEPAPDQETKT